MKLRVDGSFRGLSWAGVAALLVCFLCGCSISVKPEPSAPMPWRETHVNLTDLPKDEELLLDLRENYGLLVRNKQGDFELTISSVETDLNEETINSGLQFALMLVDLPLCASLGFAVPESCRATVTVAATITRRGGSQPLVSFRETRTATGKLRGLFFARRALWPWLTQRTVRAAKLDAFHTMMRKIDGRVVTLRPTGAGDEVVVRPPPVEPYEFAPRPATGEGGVADRFAVVVGIAEYEHAGKGGLNALVYADDDAQDFAKALVAQGWSKSHIKSLVNEQATERNVRIALESWLTKAGPDDLIVLYWSGHGFPDPEDPEKVYFACYDTDITIPATGYRMDRVRASLEERGARNVVVLADTCHAGKLITRGEKGISIVAGIEEMERKKDIPKGWIFMVGADTDRQAIEHTSWANGAFTHCLLKGMGGEADGFGGAGARDGTVTVGELRTYMSATMPDETQRVLGVAKRPIITTNTGDSDIWDLTLQVK